MFWWTLPGPRRFVEGIRRDVTDGKNVVVVLPEGVPGGLQQVLESQLNTWFFHAWSPPPDGDVRPVTWVYEHLDSSNDHHTIRNLVNDPDFEAHVCWMSFDDAALWKRWRDFLVTYAAACPGSNVDDYGRFLFTVLGSCVLHLPRTDSALSLHVYEDVTDHLDLMLYAAHTCSMKLSDGLQQRLRIEVIANLAGWDPQLVEWLADRTLEELHAPGAILDSYALHRDWSGNNDLLQQAPEWRWQRGIQSSRRDEAPLHAACSDEAMVRHLIWKAQVRVLFPFLEELRLSLLEDVNAVLEMPLTCKSGGHQVTIDDPADLEWAHLNAYLKRRGLAYKTSLGQLVRQLKDIRNDLAHLSPVSYTRLSELFRSDYDGILGSALNLLRPAHRATDAISLV